MRYFVGLITVLVLAMPLSADSMPTWTAEQQEVIGALQACWDSWYEGFDEWVETCRPVDDFVAWWPDDSLDALEDQLRVGRKFREGLEENRFYDISPRAVQVFGDTAVVYYKATWWDRQWGEELRAQERRAEVFLRIDGRWCAAGGMVAEVE